MRIALLSYEYPPETGFGGIGTYTYYQAHALRRLGHDVHVFAGTTKPERRTYDDRGVTVTRFRKVGPVERMVRSANDHQLWWFQNRLQTASSMFAAVRRATAEQPFDVIEMPECGGDGAFLNQFAHLPTVVRLHSPAELIMPTYDTKALDRVLTGAIERLGMTGARAISSCSHWLAREVRERMAVDRPVEVIPNGIDLRLFDQDEGIDIHERFGIPQDSVKVFFANRLEPRKGIHVVRDLLVPILERHPDVVFVLAGADPDDLVNRQFRPMLEQHGLGSRLFHLGRLELREVRACLKQSDVFLLTSIWENAPYSLLEAMSAGRVIVASDCGGVPEIIRHEVDGLVARTNDADSFRRALDRVLKSDALRLRFARSARQRIEARFTDDRVARRSLAFYEWALGARGALRGAVTGSRRLEIGPENWFQAWWLRLDTAGQAPALRSAPDGTPAFAGCSLDEISFAQRVLSRTYWDGPGTGDTAEARFLEDLAAVHRERALSAHREGREPESTTRLALPALTHPLFAAHASAKHFLDELWRLGDSPDVADWLAREIDAPEFVENAQRHLALRRLAVRAARLDPDARTYEILRRIYRAVGTSSRVVEQDREYIESDRHGAEFGRAVDELGLHAPMRRPPVFGRKKRRARGTESEAPDVTVLIPSYRHQEFVADAIRSALDQDLAPVRVLVVDDCSPDDTVKVARAVKDDRVEVRVNERNLGLGGSIDAALDSIETPYVALLNSDDLFHPERLGRCITAIGSNPGKAIAATGILTMDEKERLLTVENVCAVESGPAVAGWLRWYAEVQASLGAPEDWCSFGAMLRHNHLVTSSNVVCETDFLREHRERLRELRYCLDWMLFLQAAVADRLVFVPDALLGYRLHGSNTVWFDDDGRADYVHEVNHVAATSLRTLVDLRREQGTTDQDLLEELSRLLRQDVARHGETDGFELILADLLRRRPPDPHATEDLTTAPESTLLARDALSRKSRDRSLADLELPPWKLRELETGRDRMRITTHLAEGLAASDPALRREHRRLESEVEDLSARVGDADAMREEFDRQLQEWSADRERAQAEVERLTGIEHDRDRLATEVERLETEVGTLSSESSARGATNDQLTSQLARTTGQLEQARRRADDAERRIEQLRERAAENESDRSRIARYLELSRASLRHVFQQRIDAIDGLTRSPQWTFGRFLVDGLHLGGLFKTAARALVLTRTRGGRGMARAARTFGSPPHRVVIASDGPAGALADRRPLELTAVFANAGVDVRLLSWGRGDPPQSSIDAGVRRPRRHRLLPDAALFGADRRRFERSQPEALARLRELLEPRHDLGPLCTFATWARAVGATSLHASGFGAAALQAFAASRLLGIPYGLSVEGRDLLRRHVDDDLLRTLLGDAAHVAVDRPATSRALVDRTGATIQDLRTVLPVPGGTPDVEPDRRSRTGRFLLGCFGPTLDGARALELADALRRAIEAGADVGLEVLGPGRMDDSDVEAMEWLHAIGKTPALRGRLAVIREPNAEHVRGLLRRADAFLDVDNGTSPAASLGRALRAGLPIVGWGPSLRGLIEDGVQGVLVEPTDPTALAGAFGELAGNRERLATMGAAGQKLAETLRAANDLSLRALADQPDR